MNIRMLSLVLASFFVTVGCGGDKDCTSLCEEGQDGNCTAIKGNCSSFCSALDEVEDPSGCTDERIAYEDCLNEESDVCDASCDAKENALAQCVGQYCLSNLGSDACQTLATSY